MKIQSINAGYNSRKQVNKQTSPAFKRQWQEHVSWGANFIKEKGKTDFKLFSFPDAKAVFVEVADKALVRLSNIKSRVVQVIATAGAALSVNDIKPKDEQSRVYPMEHKGDGVFEAKNVSAQPGDKYRYVVVTKNNEVNLVKDPYAKKQEEIHGWSSVYNPDNYEWKNTDWLEGKDPRRIVRKPDEPMRGLENLIIDEINIPTVTKKGTFESAKERIDVIADRGIATAVELMPVENTSSKQWGYDGVDKFAVNEKLGGAAKLKELIDYAHGKGLNVIMDMVPNHMGPDGDYLKETGPYESSDGQFGAKLNYEGDNNRYVRDWMTNAALWWANEFKVDGIRFDMTKETASDYVLKQFVDELNEHNPNVFTIAEDGRENKNSVTRYDINDNSHKDKLDFIDMNIDFINQRNWKSTPHAIGFDSEWDFPFMHAFKNGIITSNQASLNRIDELMQNSKHRIKYVMSHDEIGNVDGTRLIPKVVAQYANLFNNMSGVDDADRGQKAAQLSQKLTELVISKENLSDKELAKIQKEYGLTISYTRAQIKTAIMAALAKQRLAQGSVMTIPGPKMYFQGDDNADLSQFKFFREFSTEQERIKDSSRAIREKGYDTLAEKAMPDCVLGRVKPAGEFKNLEEQMTKYNQDLKKIITENPALVSGELAHLYKDHGNLVHIHGAIKGDNDIVVFKNFADVFYNGNYSTLGFPKEGKWVEIFNSDSVEYGGGGHTNEGRVISDLDQNMKLAANSIVILKRIE